jgi:hypothetical protein
MAKTVAEPNAPQNSGRTIWRSKNCLRASSENQELARKKKPLTQNQLNQRNTTNPIAIMPEPPQRREEKQK